MYNLFYIKRLAINTHKKNNIKSEYATLEHKQPFL